MSLIIYSLTSTTQNGMPITFDDTEYQLADPMSKSPRASYFHPSNDAAHKLSRCVECMRDIEEMLQTIPKVKSVAKRRRRLKQLFTPLYSFITCIVDLMHDIQTNPETRSCINSKETASIVTEMEKRFKANIPTTLRLVRDKMSAHVDKNLHSCEAQQIFSKADFSQVGFWLHSSLCVLADLLKLPIYQWSCDSRSKGSAKILPSGSLVLIEIGIDENNRPSHIKGASLVKQDPRNEIFLLIKKIVASSRWMFRKHDPQITGFAEDKPGSSWAKSLETLLDDDREDTL